MSKKAVAYIIGYGSLLYPSGINGRRMHHQYTWDDLQVVVLKGYERGMYSSYNGILYYGIIASINTSFQAVLIPIYSEHDKTALLRDEGALPIFKPMMYQPTDVTDSVTPVLTINEIEKGVPIITLVNDDLERLKGSKISPWYVDNVWEGIQHWGPGFVELFLKTGGVKPE